MDLSDSPARKTVEFGRAITGQELIDAVEKTCEQAGGALYKEKILDEDIMYLVGRQGWNDADNLLVTPDRTTAPIAPEKTYTSAVVVRHDQPVAGREYDESGPYTRDQEIQSVVTFSEKLAQAVRQQQEPGLEKGLNPNALTVVSRPAPGSAAEAADWHRRDTGTAHGRTDGPHTR
ncbi:hypothetical protein [Kribbella soli]|uniref:Uncharacterized protein n=1 Tax=Kribbella soli TaxID=1124743 RepID=A0A4V2LYS8_9ACTN|nr:hypothetical protein [Kribbella soli]TCC05476.1 hypothetical protein E0H45_26010 [Kribbella soli]